MFGGHDRDDSTALILQAWEHFGSLKNLISNRRAPERKKKKITSATITSIIISKKKSSSKKKYIGSVGFEEVAAPITSFSALKQKRNSSQRTSTFLRAPNYTERCATEGLTEEPAPLRHQMDQISSSNRFPTETAQKADGGRICAKPQAMGCSQIAQIYSANSSNEGKRWHVFSHAVTQEGHDMIMLSRKETIWQKRRQKSETAVYH